MFTKDTPCLALNAFQDEVVKMIFVLLPLDRYSFREVISKQNVLFLEIHLLPDN